LLFIAGTKDFVFFIIFTKKRANREFIETCFAIGGIAILYVEKGRVVCQSLAALKAWIGLKTVVSHGFSIVPAGQERQLFVLKTGRLSCRRTFSRQGWFL
jgi:hypothetical protein